MYIMFDERYDGFVFTRDPKPTDETVVAWSSPNAERNDSPLPRVHLPFWCKKACPLVHNHYFC